MLVIDKIMYLLEHKKCNQNDLSKYLNIPENNQLVLRNLPTGRSDNRPCLRNRFPDRYFYPLFYPPYIKFSTASRPIFKF